MDETFEDSFLVKRKVRAVIDSDSDEDSDNVSVIEDSFEEESPKKQDKITFSTDGSEDTTDDIAAGDEEEDGEIIAPSDDDESVPIQMMQTSRLKETDNIFRETRESSEIVERERKHQTIDTASEETGIDQLENSLEILENSLSVLELSSDEEGATSSGLKQLTMNSFLIKPEVPKPKSRSPQKIVVGSTEYTDQQQIIQSVEAELLRTKNAMRIIKLENLPDKGKSLLDKISALEKSHKEKIEVLSRMVVDENIAPANARNKIDLAWDQIEAGVDAVGPRTFGKKGVARFNNEKQLAVETLDHLHKSLDTCPTENDFADDPKHLKVPLMPHQKRALAWLLWREKQKPPGGLLADDMGLGKTLTMISLIMKSKELETDDDVDNEKYRDKYPGGTLVVCPASLIHQWAGEIENKTKRGVLSVEVYHGAKRETKAKRLAEHDVVITTYGLVPKESNSKGTLFRIRWRRIILDEAHQIRNHKSQTAESVFKLVGKSRWALTGTPVHNKELDMYAVLKFLRCAPFDDLQVWKRWISDKSTGGEMRLHAVISTLMLRRTKVELMEKGSLQNLPERKWELISIKLEKDEMDVYQKVLIFSRTLFAQFLHQRAEKSQDAMDLRFTAAPPDPNGEYFKMRNHLLKLNRVKEVSQHEILVLLLRLRQICCHPYLIRQMLQGDEDIGDAEDYEQSEEMNLLDQLNKMSINDTDEYNPTHGLSDENVGLKEASKGFLNPSNPVFRLDRASSKIKTLIKILQEKVSTGDKAIVVSQWTSLLDLIATHIKDEGIKFDSLTGKTVAAKRMIIVDNFNDPKSETRVLLLSLTAGGVGLNLVGANHLFLLDLHWNPQLESQAQDRIYRMGQKKPIFVYKLMAEDTIEERIKALQEKKLDIANSMLTGSKRVIDNKLSLQDLKMLFDFK